MAGRSVTGPTGLPDVPAFAMPAQLRYTAANNSVCARAGLS